MCINRAIHNGVDWSVESTSLNYSINCLQQHATHEKTVFAGTSNGIFKSSDAGLTWHPCGLSNISVKSIAVNRANPDLIVAGTKPPALYVSHDASENWAELPALRQQRRWFWFTPAEPGDPYVMSVAISPTDPNIMIAGIEFGAMLRTTDGGQTWSRHLSHTSRDCHNLKFHSRNPNWVYQAAGGWPASYSRDGGNSWTQPRQGLGWNLYSMAIAADPFDPQICYLSASPHVVFPDVHKMPRGHFDGEAHASIFRMDVNKRWKKLSGGLPQPLAHMAYALVTDCHASGHLYAGLSNGDIWFTENYGETWRQLALNLTGIHYSLVMIKA